MTNPKKERTQNVVTRRNLLKGSAAVAAGAGVVTGEDLYNEIKESDTGLIPVGRVTGATINQDQQMNNGGDDGGVRQTNLSFTEIMETENIQSGDPFVYSLFSTDGEILAWNNDPGKAMMYDTQTSKLKWEKSIPPGDPNNAVIDNNGNPIINTLSGTLKLDNKTGKKLQRNSDAVNGGLRRYEDSIWASKSGGVIKMDINNLSNDEKFDIVGGGPYRGGMVEIDDNVVAFNPGGTEGLISLNSNTGDIVAENSDRNYNWSISAGDDFIAVGSFDGYIHLLDKELNEVSKNSMKGERIYSSPSILEEDGETKVYLGDFNKGTVEGHSLSGGELERDFVNEVGEQVANTTVVGDTLLSYGDKFTITNRHTGEQLEQYDKLGIGGYPHEDMIPLPNPDGLQILYMNEEDIGGGGKDPASLELGGFEGVPEEVQLGNSFEYGIPVTNTGGREADVVVQHFLTSGDAEQTYKVEVDSTIPSETEETYAFTADTTPYDKDDFSVTGETITYPIKLEGSETTVTLEAVLPETPEETNLNYANQRLQGA